jgi:hypothetical protein
MKCDNCGEIDHSPDAYFCHICGEKLIKEPTRDELNQLDLAIGQERTKLRSLRAKISKADEKVQMWKEDYDAILGRIRNTENNLLFIRQKAKDKLIASQDMIAVLDFCFSGSKKLEKEIQDAKDAKKSDILEFVKNNNWLKNDGKYKRLQNSFISHSECLSKINSWKIGRKRTTAYIIVAICLVLLGIIIFLFHCVVFL